jgi:hypothetical protein
VIIPRWPWERIYVRLLWRQLGHKAAYIVAAAERTYAMEIAEGFCQADLFMERLVSLAAFRESPDIAFMPPGRIPFIELLIVIGDIEVDFVSGELRSEKLSWPLLVEIHAGIEPANA